MKRRVHEVRIRKRRGQLPHQMVKKIAFVRHNGTEVPSGLPSQVREIVSSQRCLIKKKNVFYAVSALKVPQHPQLGFMVSLHGKALAFYDKSGNLLRERK